MDVKNDKYFLTLLFKRGYEYIDGILQRMQMKKLKKMEKIVNITPFSYVILYSGKGKIALITIKLFITLLRSQIQRNVSLAFFMRKSLEKSPFL